MEKAIINTTNYSPSTTVANLSSDAIEFLSNAKASNTLKAYRSDWAEFTAWCSENGVQALPATSDTVANYVSALAKNGSKFSTIQRRISTISQAHKAAELDSPTKSYRVAMVLDGIKREITTVQTGKAAAKVDDIALMVSALGDTTKDIRDRALLLVGFAGAFRRSELVALDVADIEFVREGVKVTIRKSKTDQFGEGRKVGIPYGVNEATCPVRALQAWLNVSGIADGAIFRSLSKSGKLLDRLSDQSVALVMKERASAAGLDSSKYAGHSLRAGLATTAAASGKTELSIMKQTGHKSVEMVRRYIREGSLFLDNAAAGIGL